MAQKLAQRMNVNGAGALIGKLHDLSGKPGYYSFASGMPNEISFPVDAISAAADAVLDSGDLSMFQYNTTDDYLPLKQVIVDRYAKVGLHVTTDDILITSSSSQALDISAKAFLNKGDGILVESPTFMSALNTFMTYQAEIFGVPVDENGIDIPALRQTLAEKKPKMAYIIPTFQNPSGVTYPEENRIALAEAFAEHDVILLEDDPYGELRFEGTRLPPLKKYVGDMGLVLGSFSKIVSPGMRLGWICCTKPELMEVLRAVKQQCDIHAEAVSMRTMAEYFAQNDVDAHIDRVKLFYRDNAKAMLDAMDKYFPEGIHRVRPQGGLFTWVDLPEAITVGEMFDALAERMVIFFPGTTFFVNPEAGNHSFRLSYSCVDAETIDKGIHIMGDVIKEILARKEAR